MNLYELQKEINLKKTYKQLVKDKIKFLRESLEPAGSYIKEVTVSGSSPKKDIADVFNNIVELEKEVKMYDEDLKILDKAVDELEKVFKKFNDIYQLIYLEYKIRGYTANKIAMKNGYSCRQVYRIVKRIDKEFKDVTKCQ